MAGIGARLKAVLTSKSSKALDKVEDPAAALDLAYREQQKLLQKVKEGIVQISTTEKRLASGKKQHEDSIVRLDTQARAALAQGKEDLAREALNRKTIQQQELIALDEQVAAMAGQKEELIAREKQLRKKVETFRTKKEVMKAQYQAAKSQVKISETMSGLGSEDGVGAATQRALEKTEEMKARAGALTELESGGTFDSSAQLGAGGDDIDRQLDELGAGYQVEEQIQAMKAELGQSNQDKSALQAGADKSDTTDEPTEDAEVDTKEGQT